MTAPTPAGVSVPARAARRGRGVTREDILRVARDHAVAVGWRSARVQQIAAELGISRPTLYRTFPSKDELGQALLTHEVDTFTLNLRATAATTDGDLEAVVCALVDAALTEVDSSPFLGAIVAEGLVPPEGSDGHLPAAIPVSRVARRCVTDLLVRRFGEMGPDRLAIVADVAVRLSVSHMLEPAAERDQIAERIASVAVLAATV